MKTRLDKAVERARTDWVHAAEVWNETFPPAFDAYKNGILPAEEFEAFMKLGDQLGEMLRVVDQARERGPA